MVPYYCKSPECHTWLFDSDATYGRWRGNCPKCHRRQMHFLGGFQTKPAEAVPDQTVDILMQVTRPR